MREFWQLSKASKWKLKQKQNETITWWEHTGHDGNRHEWDIVKLYQYDDTIEGSILGHIDQEHGI